MRMKGKRMEKPELLAPGGSLEKLKIAILYGADAVYVGGEAYSLRVAAENFTFEEMKEGLSFAHERGKKVYLTANIIPHNDDIKDFEKYIEKIAPLGFDAILVADPGMMEIVKEKAPDLPIHISTQANNVNYKSAAFWYKQGAKRVVLAREMSMDEIKEIRENTPAGLELEAFVHGAMCISYSGRCLLSNYFTGRDANKGACTHPCRWKYSVVEEKRPGEYLPVYENERGTYIFNSKDLCMIEHIPDLIDAGIDSYKIEGRMKTALYVATVARTYRKAIDDYLESPEKYKNNMPWYLEQIKSCTYRQFTTGFFYGKPSEETQIYDNNTYEKGYTYLGIVGEKDESGMYRLEQRNKFSVGETIEVMKPNGENIEVVVKAMKDEEGQEIDSCPHPKQIFYVDLGIELNEYDILRRQEEDGSISLE